MTKPCDSNLKDLFRLVEQMIDLASRGYEEQEDDGCAILYGVLLDSAYKLQKLAEIERDNHIKKGWWK